MGVALCSELDCDNCDNGVYEIDPETMEIMGRQFSDCEQQNHDPEEIATTILERIALIEAHAKQE